MNTLLGDNDCVFYKVFPRRADHDLPRILPTQCMLRLFRVHAPETGSIQDIHFIVCNVNIDWAFCFAADDSAVPSGLFQVYAEISTAVGMADCPCLRTFCRDIKTA